jgi:hypothetical protein
VYIVSIKIFYNSIVHANVSKAYEITHTYIPNCPQRVPVWRGLVRGLLLGVRDGHAHQLDVGPLGDVNAVGEVLGLALDVLDEASGGKAVWLHAQEMHALPLLLLLVLIAVLALGVLGLDAHTRLLAAANLLREDDVAAFPLTPCSHNNIVL